LQTLLDYFAALRGFSSNAKLFLIYALLSGLGTGIWNVMFNIYLLRLGYETTFVGLFWMMNMVFHGAFAFPAGLIGDKIGRRKTFILATTFSIVARGALLFTRDPTLLLVLAGLAGMGEGFHAVAGAPFMMENSEPKERPHLFSLNSSFLMISTFAGSLSGGLLPLFWAGILNVPGLDPGAARWALVTSLPLTFVALVPLALIRERTVDLVERFRDLFTLRNVVNYGVIFKLTLCAALVGVGFGMTVRFFNLFFNMAHNANDNQVGLFLAIASLGSALTVLLSPYVTGRWGMARGIMLTQIVSIPFLLLMTVFSNLPLVVSLFVVRGAVYTISMPLRNQLSMVFVISRERATTAGMTHMAFDLGGAVGAVVVGVLIVGGEFLGAFSVAAGLLIVPAVLYYVFFAKMEDAQRAVAPVR
jgi:MFS family permease